MSKRDSAGGFTLIELVVSLLLLGLVMTLVFGAFAQISGSALELRDELTERQELRLLTRMISDDLQAAQFLTQFALQGVEARTGILAEPEFVETKEYTRIAFHAARPARFYRDAGPESDPGVHEIGYRVRRSEDRTRMLLERREDYYVDDELEAGGVTVELADGIEAFLIEFLPRNAAPTSSEEPWRTEWNSPQQPEPERMPVAIRLTVARKDAQGRSYSETLEFNLPGSLTL